MINNCHSVINSYPPNPILYPNFYKCKELTFVLNPGDMLFIPKGWFHWVFSYPDTRENIAVSYAILDDNNDIRGEFKNQTPFIHTLDNIPLENYTFNTLQQKYQSSKFTVLKSKQNSIIPVIKTKHSQCKKDYLTLTEIKSQQDIYNLYIGQDSTFEFPTIPNIILQNFPNSTIKYFYWLSLFNKTTKYIESGLHYDNYHGLLAQIKGTKIVKLYSPKYLNNLYCKDFTQI